MTGLDFCFKAFQNIPRFAHKEKHNPVKCCWQLSARKNAMAKKNNENQVY